MTTRNQNPLWTRSAGGTLTEYRMAVVVGGADDLAHVQAYMPANYSVSEVELGPSFVKKDGTLPVVYIITGEDSAGWTLDGYVIPRLASGLIFAMEVTGS